jgi:UPF0755 protein
VTVIVKNHWLVDILLFILGAFLNGALLIALALGVWSFFERGRDMGAEYAGQMTAERPSREIEFILDDETDVADAARMMEEMGIIENQYLFRLELFLKNSSKTYRAGTYTLDSGMSNTMINATLRRAPQAEIQYDRITIREGFSIRDIAVYLEGRDLMTAEEFIQACNEFDEYFWFLYDIPARPNRLEGYLFPDTYFITQNPTPNEIIYKMLHRFEEVFTHEYRRRAEELEMTIDEIVIIASMIEKEVRVPSERALVSQVIYNRLNIGMPLQIDATVLFALDKRADRLLLVDLEFDSPYNTYVYGGLPIGPIGSPGVNCIHAALYPEEGTYFYYVVSNPETGEHQFSRTFEEHQRAAALYRQLLDN